VSAAGADRAALPVEPPGSAPADPALVSLVLFVSGASSPSARAVTHVQALCEEQLGGRYLLSVVDVHQNPELTQQHGVMATPTLLRESPPPHRIRVGDFSDHQAVLAALGLVDADPDAAAPDIGHGPDHDRPGRPGGDD
jgi:circadian clock protein KaiB